MQLMDPLRKIKILSLLKIDDSMIGDALHNNKMPFHFDTTQISKKISNVENVRKNQPPVHVNRTFNYMVPCPTRNFRKFSTVDS